MSVSKFCRNFLTYTQMGVNEKSCHTTGERQHRNNDPKKPKCRDSHSTAAHVNTEEQEYFDVPLVVVFFPEGRKKHSDYRLRESTAQKKTQHRLSTMLQKDDSAERGKGFSKIKVPVQLATSQDIKQLNQDNSRTEEKVIEDCILFSVNCTTLVEQLPDNTGLVENNIQPFQLEDSQIQTKASVPVMPNGLVTPDADSPLGCTNSGLVSAFKRSSENVCNKVVRDSKVAILREPRTSSTTKTKYNQTQGKGYTTKLVTSLASGIVYEDEVSSPEGSRCSSTAQTLISSNNSETDEEVPAPSTLQATNKQGFSHLESMVTSKLPPGSTLISDRGAFHTNDREKPYACGYSGNNYRWRQGVYRHIMKTHEEKHETIHAQEKPFTCDQCGMRFRLKTDHCRHELMHTEQRVFPCKICNKSYTSKCNLLGHSEVYKQDEYRECVTCNICKKEFRHHHHLKEHMMIHTDKKPFKCSLCDENFRLELHLLHHMITHKATRNLLLGEPLDPEESTIKVHVQLVTSQGIEHQDDYHLGENTAQMKTQNVKPEHRLSSALQKEVSADKGKEFSLIMDHRCNIEQKDTNCSSDEAHVGVPPSSSSRATGDHGISSSFCSKAESMVSSKLPPGSTLVSDRGAFLTNDREKPYACGYCGNNYKRKKDVYRHVVKTHEEKYATIHAQEKPFTCDQCGMRFRLKTDHSRHELMHTEERVFPCQICNKSYTSKCNLFGHSEVYKQDEYREGVTCNICKKEFRYHHHLMEHMMTHTGEKPFKCSLCDKNFRLELHLMHHMITHDEMRNLLLGEPHDPEESIIKVPVQLANSQGITQFSRDNSKTEEKVKFQDCISSSINCTTLVEQLPDNSGLVAFLLEDSQLQAKPTSSGLATTDADSTLGCTNSRLVSAFKRSSENVYNKVISDSKVAIPGEPRTSSPTKTKSNETEIKGYLTKVVNTKLTSPASGIVYEGEVSSPEGTRCSSTAQTLLSSSNSEMAEEVPAPSTFQANNNQGTLSSGFSHVESMVSSKLPPGSTLLSDRGVFHTNNREKPFACGYCGNNYKWRKGLYRHILMTHEEKDATSHAQEKPFTCDQCGMRFRLKTDHCRHIFLHTEERLFPCKKRKKSYKSKGDLFSHREVHKKADYTEGVVCNICKKEFKHHCHLKEHMTTHTGEKPFKCSLCDENFRLEQHLLHHMITHKKLRNLLLGEPLDLKESTVKVPVELATSQGIKQFNQDDYHLGENTELLHYKCSFCGRIFRLELHLLHHMITHKEKRNLLLGEARTSDTKGKKSNQTQGKGYPTKAVNGKRISVASGIVYEDEVSSPEGSRCSSRAQTLLSSTNSEVVKEEVSAPSTLQANNNQGTSSSGFSHVESMLSSKLPPGSTLVSDVGVCRIKDKQKPFACAYCAKAYKLKKSVFCHIRRIHREKRYSCEFCGNRYALQYDLDLHMALHKREKRFTCDQCGKHFRWQNGLRRHKFTHTQVRPFVCKICNKSYKCNDALIKHTIIHNQEEFRGNICDICKRKFRRPWELRLHMTIHTGEKPFKCRICDKQFRLKIGLQSHLNAHSGLRRTCAVCGKTVAARSIYTHMKMHKGPTGEKPFECNICGKRFPRKPNLEGHMRSHTGEKPFACGGCDKRFALYSNMMTHKAKCKKTSDKVT